MVELHLRFCTIDIASKMIISASPALSDTLGCPKLEGVRFIDFVESNDDLPDLGISC